MRGALERVQGRIRRHTGESGEGAPRGFSLTHIEGERGRDLLADAPLAHLTPSVHRSFARARSPGGGEWFVCLFRENGRAAAIGKNFIYMIEKCFLCGRASARTAPKKTRRVVPLSLHSPRTSSLANERFLPFFYTPASESARGG